MKFNIECSPRAQRTLDIRLQTPAKNAERCRSERQRRGLLVEIVGSDLPFILH
jgi:hypothetical protein